MMLFISCQKEPVGIKVIKKLTVNPESHTFINDDGNHYFPNTLLSLQDNHKYELVMNKDVLYRISATQPDVFLNRIQLTLVNTAGDTIAISVQEGPAKSFIVTKCPATKSYFLTVSLQKSSNPSFNYRLYFEEIVDETESFSGYGWYSSGEWISKETNSIELKNHDSRFYRHLKLQNSITGNPDISFTVQSGSAENFSFGFVFEPSDAPLQFSDYAYDLPDRGKAFIYFFSESKYSIININTGEMSLFWEDFSNSNLDLTAGIKVELKYQNNEYNIYLNGKYVRYIGRYPGKFMILLEEKGNGISKIRDFKLL